MNIIMTVLELRSTVQQLLGVIRTSNALQMHFLQTHFGLDVKAKQHYAAMSTLQTYF
jgi:hypothetical protein